jgi:hypothetical protein
MLELVLPAAVIGGGATVLMDIWAIVLNKAFGVGLPRWGMVGRWVGHLRHGKIFHDDIGKAAPVANEVALGWAFHYAVGIAYGLILVAVAGAQWLASPTFLPAFILGMVTVGAGWFLLAPGMGAGWASSKMAQPMKVRGLNLLGHTVFAIGLYGTALLIRQ